MNEQIQWRGTNVSDLSLDILKKLDATLKHHLNKRADTKHNKRTKKLKIDFKQTHNKYFVDLHAAVTAQLKAKQ